MMRPSRLVLVAMLAGCTATTPDDDPNTPPAVVITRPAADELILRGSVQHIEWEPPAGVDEVDLLLDQAVIASHVPNTGTYAWTVPFAAGADTGVLRAVASGEPS